MTETWYERWSHATELPEGALRAAAFAEAAELAAAAGDVDAEIECRVAAIDASHGTDRLIEAVDDLDRCLTVHADDPARFAEFEPAITSALELLPTAARRDPRVPIEKVLSLTEAVDRWALDRGAGPGPGSRARLEMRLETGVGEPIDQLLTEWKAGPVTHDRCRCCDLHLEVRAALALDRADEAITAVAPLLTGQMTACADSLAPIGALMVAPLLDAGRDIQAAELFRLALRTARRGRQGDAAARLAAIAARSQDRIGARRIRTHLGPILEPLDPFRLLIATAHLARAAIDDAGEARRHAEAAAESAAVFDTRNGTDTVGRRVDAIIRSEPLSPVPLRMPPDEQQGDPDRALDDIEGAVGLSGAAPEAPAMPKTDPAPLDDALTFHRWALAQMDAWRPDVVRTAATRWTDRSLEPGLRAASALWALATGAGPDADGIEALADAVAGTGTDEVEAGLLAEGARRIATTDPDRSRALARRALDRVEDGSLDARNAVTIARTAAIGLAAAGDSDGVLRALGLVRQHDPGPESGDVAAVLAALSAVEIADRGVTEGADDENHRRLRAATDRLSSAAGAVLARSPDPLAVHGLAQAARRRLRLDQPDAAATHLHRAIAAIPVGPTTAALRADLHLVQADAIAATTGEEAALPAAVVAVRAAVESESDRAIGVTRRALASRLARLDRSDDARIQMLEALEMLARAGVDAGSIAPVRIATARSALRTGRTTIAGDLAETVLLELGDAPDLDEDLLAQALDIAADAAFTDDDVDTALAHLERLATQMANRGRPAALARANAGRAAARARRIDRADELFTMAAADLDAIDDRGDLDSRERLRTRVVVAARRAEVLWWTRRFDEAVDCARQAMELGADLDDQLFDARLMALIARARHDRARRRLSEGSDATELLRAAEDALVNAIQRARTIDDDTAADELSRRLTSVRNELS